MVARFWLTKNLLYLFLGFSLFLSNKAIALNDAPQTYTVDGVLYQTGTTNPLIDSSIILKVEILDPSKTCMLYEETQTVSTSSSAGYFNIQVGSAVGSGKRTANDAGRTMAQVFQNMTAITAKNAPSQTCVGLTYTPTAGDIRYFRIIVTPSGTGTPDTLSPDMVIDSSPNAIVAQSLQGLEKANILQVNGAANTTQATLESWLSSTMMSQILAGTYVASSATTATTATNVSGIVAVVNGGTGANTPAGARTNLGLGSTATTSLSGVATDVLHGDGSWSAPAAAPVTSVAGRTGAVVITSADLADFNTAADARITLQKGAVNGLATLNGSGKVPSTQLALVASDIPNLDASKITTGTITNNISSTLVSGTTGQFTNLKIYDGTANYLTMTSPVGGFGGSGYTVQWPSTVGAANQVLSINSVATGTATLSWITPNAGTVTGVTATAPIASSGGAAPNITIAQSNTTTDGYLSSADWNTFNGKQNALGYTPVNKAGDTMTGALNLPSNGLAVGTNQLVVSGGKVGIGTASPQAELDINQGTLLFVNQTNNTVTHTLASKFIGTTTDNRLVLTSSGNAAGTRFWIDTPSGTTSTGFSMAYNGTEKMFFGANSSNGYLQNYANFLIRNSGGSTVAVIKTTGAMSLGTNSAPLSMLDVNGGVAIGTYAVTNAAPANGLIVSGNVGIGNNSPLYALDVAGDINVTGNFKINGTNINAGTVTSVATGTGLTGGPITSTGTISLANTAVTAGSYGTSTSVPSFTVDAQGRLTAASATAIPTANTTTTGLLTGADWTTFNGKQAAGNYITALTGDVTASGPGSAAATIANNAVTTAKIADGAVTTVKAFTNPGASYLVSTDATTGATLAAVSCGSVDQVLKWTLTGWTCATVSSLSPVTSVAGKTGAVTLASADIADATNANTGSMLVKRDPSGNFSAGAITATGVVTGTLQVTGGTIATGKVLTSDASGNATWQAIPSFVTSVTAAATAGNPITIGGSGTAPTVDIPVATSLASGYLSSADWSTFNGKQAAGNYITDLTGDVTAAGPGSAAATIANNAVTTAKIIDGAVTTAKAFANPGINRLVATDGTTGATLAAITCATVGQVLKWTASGWACTDAILADGSVSMTGGFKAASGTAAAPGMTFASDTGLNTGFFLAAQNQIGFATNGAEVVRIDATGDVGVGTTAPRTLLDVKGAMISRASVSNASGTIDFLTGNIQHTTSNCGSFALWNLKDGGSYMFVVKGTSVATCSFTAFSDGGTTALTVHLPPGHGATSVGTHTMYNIAVSGGDAYLAWTPGY